MFKKIYRTALQTVNRINKDEIFVYAAQASFYIITASIPFMMLFLALLKFFIPISEKEAIESVIPFIPTMLQAPVETIISELFAKATAIISITSITAIWSASRGVAAVERGVKKVYKTQPSPNVIKGISFSILYTVLFMIVLLATLLLVVFGGIIYTLLNKHFTWLIALDRVMGGFREVMYFFGMIMFFSFVYKVFAGKGAKFKDQICGAIFTTAGWFLFSFFFSLYVENFANFSYVYGSLTVLVLMMLWLYSCMIILLLGAELNIYIGNRKNETV